MSSVPLFAREGAEFLGVTTLRRKLRFEYALFERRSGPYKLAGIDSVEADSEESVQLIVDTAHSYIESHLKHGKNTGNRILTLYQVRRSDFLFGPRLTGLSPGENMNLRLQMAQRPRAWPT